MNARNRIWVLIIAVATVGVLALGWFVGVSPRLEEARQADEARGQVESTIAQYEAQLQKLKTDYEGIDDLRLQLDAIEKKLPQTPEYAEYLETLTSMLDGTGAGISNVSWGTPSLVSADAAGDTGAPTEDSGTAPTGTLVLLPITLTVDGQIPSILSYVTRLQQNERYILISNVVLTKSTNPQALGGTFSAVLQAGVFLVVGPETFAVDDVATEDAAVTAP